jgi:hypothetical protein
MLSVIHIRPGNRSTDFDSYGLGDELEILNQYGPGACCGRGGRRPRGCDNTYRFTISLIRFAGKDVANSNNEKRNYDSARAWHISALIRVRREVLHLRLGL